MSRSHNTKPLRLDDWHDRSDRHNARADLHKTEEPEPVQGRSRAIWDAW